MILKPIYYLPIERTFTLLPIKFWDLADKHAYTQLGGEIAWGAASSRLGGECEGDIECNFRREGMSNIAYLQRYPTGNHVAEALGEFGEILTYLVAALKEDPHYFRVSPEMALIVKRYVYTVGKTCGPQAAKRDSVIAQLKVHVTSIIFIL